MRRRALLVLALLLVLLAEAPAPVLAESSRLRELQEALETANEVLLELDPASDEVPQVAKKRVYYETLLNSIRQRLTDLVSAAKTRGSAEQSVHKPEEQSPHTASFGQKLAVIDIDDSQSISYSELLGFFEAKRGSEVRKRAGLIATMFEAYDENQDGKVTSAEYFKQVDTRTRGFQALLAYFAFADTDASNDLERREFGNLFHLVGLDGSPKSEEWKMIVVEQQMADVYAESLLLDGDESDYASMTFAAYSKTFGQTLPKVKVFDTLQPTQQPTESAFASFDVNSDNKLDLKELGTAMFPRPQLPLAVVETLKTVSAASGDLELSAAKEISIGFDECIAHEKYLLSTIQAHRVAIERYYQPPRY